MEEVRRAFLVWPSAGYWRLPVPGWYPRTTMALALLRLARLITLTVCLAPSWSIRLASGREDLFPVDSEARRHLPASTGWPPSSSLPGARVSRVQRGLLSQDP